jgi:hypothetical protein
MTKTFPKSPHLGGRTQILAILANLVLFSQVGFLIRIGLTVLHTYPVITTQGALTQPVFAGVYPQFVGCVIMMWCVTHQKKLEER